MKIGLGTIIRRLFVTIILLLVLLIISLLGLMYFGVTVDLGFLKGGVESSAGSVLGRTVAIEGPVVLEFSEWPAIEVRDVRVANLPDASNPDFLHAGLARIQVGIFPLLKGNIEIGEVTAADVTLNLENNAEGQQNWDFGAAKGDGSEPATPDKKTETKPAGEKSFFSFGGVHKLLMENIVVTYHDAPLDKTINFELDKLGGAAAPGKPINLDLEGHIQKNSYDLGFQGGSIDELLSRGKDSWQFNLAGDVFGKKIAAEGDMAVLNNEPAVNLDFSIEDVDIGTILSSMGLVEGLQASTGSMGVTLALIGNNLDEIVRNSSLTFSLRDGQWNIQSPTSDTFLDVQKLNGDILVEQGNAVTMKLDGVVGEFPVKFTITGAPLVDYVAIPDMVPLTIDAEFADSIVTFAGELSLPITDRDLNLSLAFKTDSLDNLNDALKLDLPPLGPIELATRFEVLGTRYELPQLDLKVGESGFAGKMSLDTSAEIPQVDIELISDLIRIDDFEAIMEASDDNSPDTEGEDETTSETTDEKREKRGRNLLSKEVLSSFNADLLVKAQKVTSGEDDLGSGELKLSVKDSLLALKPLRVDVPSGGVQIEFDYLPTEEGITVNVNADIEEFDIGVLVRRVKPEADMGGRLYMDAAFHSTAPDFSSVMEHAEGNFDFGLIPKDFSAGIIDLWAVNLISSIMTEVSEEEQSEINCLVVRFGMAEGLMQEKAIYMDTSNMHISGKADIDFNTREFEILMVPKAKEPEFFSLAVPIKVHGPFDDFSFGIGITKLTRAVVSFITSPIHVPIRKVFAGKIPEDGKEACMQAWSLTGEENSNSVQ